MKQGVFVPGSVRLKYIFVCLRVRACLCMSAEWVFVVYNYTRLKVCKVLN